MCTGNAFTGSGRSLGRGTADVLTLGVTAVARKKCKACDHPMSEHQGAMTNVRQQAAATSAAVSPARWVKTDDGRYRYWTGDRWTDYYADGPYPSAQKIEAARLAMTDGPPRWRQQPDGRFRWWSGSVWQNDYTRDPDGEIEYNAIEAASSAPTAPAASVADELKKMADLHASGILSDEEFAAAKKTLLGL